jgi:hypothetical protein
LNNKSLKHFKLFLKRFMFKLKVKFDGLITSNFKLRSIIFIITGNSFIKERNFFFKIVELLI